MPSNESPAFISYSRANSEFALRLAGDLKSAGASVWLDQLDIEPGHSWAIAIEQALIQAPRMLLILSPSSAKSNNVRNEIAFALDEQKVIIPILYQDCAVPLQLRGIHHVDFRTDYARGLLALLKNLGAQPRERSPVAFEIAKESQAILAAEAERMAQQKREEEAAARQRAEVIAKREAEAVEERRAAAKRSSENVAMEGGEATPLQQPRGARVVSESSSLNTAKGTIEVDEVREAEHPQPKVLLKLKPRRRSMVRLLWIVPVFSLLAYLLWLSPPLASQGRIARSERPRLCFQRGLEPGW